MRFGGATALIVLAPLAAAGEHFKLSAAVRPPIVRPGGFAEIVLAIELEPGWRTFSPRSAANGLAFSLELPHDVKAFGAALVPSGRWSDEPGLGRMEELTGALEWVQRVRVESGAAPQTRPLRGSVRVAIRDALSPVALHSQAFTVELDIAADGALGPCPPEPQGPLELTEPETAQLAERGFLLRARPEVERMVAGEGTFLLVEIAAARDASLQLSCSQHGCSFTDVNMGPAFEEIGADVWAGPALASSDGRPLDEKLYDVVVEHDRPIRAWLPIVALPADASAVRVVVDLRLRAIVRFEDGDHQEVVEVLPVSIPLAANAGAAAR